MGGKFVGLVNPNFVVGLGMEAGVEARRDIPSIC